MVRVISQETFDGVVKENMEEFDMSREDAIKEAIEQFQSQVQQLQIFIPASAWTNSSITARSILEL